MDVKMINSYKPQFGAAIFHQDARVQNFARQAYRYAYEQTEALTNSIRNMDNSTMVVLSIGEKDGKNYIIAKNPKSKVKEYLQIINPNRVEQEDRFAYTEMLSNLTNMTRKATKKFWGINK